MAWDKECTATAMRKVNRFSPEVFSGEKEKTSYQISLTLSGVYQNRALY